jgi:hypothetical protein
MAYDIYNGVADRYVSLFFDILNMHVLYKTEEFLLLQRHFFRYGISALRRRYFLRRKEKRA